MQLRRGILWAIVPLLAAVTPREPIAAMDDASPTAAPKAAADENSAIAGDEFFEKHVRPILVQSCFECHSAQAKELKGSLRLDSREGALKGGDGGVVIMPGKPEQSRLIVALGYEDPDLQMPPKKRLPKEQIATLATWIRLGAPWPKSPGNEPATSVSGSGTATSGPAKAPFDLQKRKAEHWAWQPIRAAAPPQVKHDGWAQDPLDRFLIARWEAAGLEPPELAERRVLVRRAYFDLVGLPPKPEEVDAFVHDTSPDAWPRLVDRLLASPQFGERWARHWLDLVRYGETRGHEFDYEISNAWQYRDYVIRAFNADVPYDQFVTEQIAGDLLTQPRLDPTGRSNESVLGTGFWFLGEWLHSPVDIRQDELDRIDNQLDVMGKTFLGLTLGCARCHDHKFDAISTKDYYSLAGFLESSSFREVRFEWQRQNHDKAREIAAAAATAEAKILPAIVEHLTPSLDHMAESLLAVREVLADEAKQSAGAAKQSTGAAKQSAELAKRIADVAERHKLEAADLALWVALVRKAHDESTSPLHFWSLLSKEATGEDARLGSLPTYQQTKPSWLRAANHEPAPADEEHVVVDYGHCGPGQWFTNGLAFGDAPALAGQVVLSPAWLKKSSPAAIVLDAPCAHSGLIGGGLPGMLRTPEFTITQPIVSIRMRGAAELFAVVDAHEMVAGPLHGTTKWHADAGPQWTWVSHDLRDYLGQRCHLEFTPASSSTPLAVARVVQAKSTPSGQAGSEADRLNPLVAKRLVEGGSHSLKELATAYEALVRETAADLASNQLQRGGDAEARATLANWLIENLSPTTVPMTSPAAVSKAPSQPAATLVASSSDGRAKELQSLLVDFRRQRAALLAQIKPSATAMAMLDGNGVDDHVLLRGNCHTPGEPAPRRFLEAIAGPVRSQSVSRSDNTSASGQPLIQSGSGRLELAQRLLDRSDPLPARVMANRVWQHLFGRGIVGSVDNFGVLGQKPVDPQLLDYLADRFVRDGWSVKQLIREIMLSIAYQMSSRESDDDRQRDPQNLLLHHRSLRRLEGEAIRDAMLSVAGRIDLRMYGPSVEVYLTPFMEGRGRPASGPLDGAGRRSVYLRVRRNFLSPLMTAFDTPHPAVTVGDRGTSNVPAQALILLNDPLVAELSHVWARRLLVDKALPAGERIARMYREALAREPDAAELAAALEFIATQRDALGEAKTSSGGEGVWADLGQVLFNVKEFIYLE